MQEHGKANKHLIPASSHTAQPELVTWINARENLDVHRPKFLSEMNLPFSVTIVAGDLFLHTFSRY